MTNRRPPPQPQQPEPPDTEAIERAVGELRRRLKQAASPREAEAARRSLGSDVPVYGVKAAETHRIGLELVRRLRSAPPALSLDIADALFTTGNLEEGLVGAQVLGAMARHIGGGDFARFDKWAGALTNAQTADGLAMSGIAKALAVKPSLAAQLTVWAKSPQPWRRRAAVSSFVPLVREGRFLTDALTVAEVVMADAHEEVQRGVGTLLLEASRMQSARVVEFLQTWKDKAPRLVLQIAATKLAPEDRSAVLGS